LNLDVAEIFKPIIADRIVFYLINKGVIKTTHFVKGAPWMTHGLQVKVLFQELPVHLGSEECSYRGNSYG